jgi:hypothetical protein
MSLNLNEPARPATRLRLVYRISAGAIVGESGAREAARRISRAWLDERGQVPAFRLTEATQPVQGAATGSGALGVVNAIAGTRYDWFTAIDVKTDSTLPSLTWGQLLANMRRIALGVLGADARADLDRVELVSSTAPAQVSPTAQATTAADSARTSRANAPAPKLGNALLDVLMVLALVAVVVGAVYLVRQARGLAAAA